mmetsp:Transcript_24714/g.71311  ORF Transcript_24714/g.71311 Transcript_24714/m.71311 type:complete len:363 (+) Transcript_24714:117-1205(+)
MIKRMIKTHAFLFVALLSATQPLSLSYAIDTSRFCPEGDMNLVGLVNGESSRHGKAYCWKIEGGKSAIKHGAKIVLDKCDEKDEAQLFIHCHPGQINGHGSWHIKLSPYLAPEYIVSVKAEEDGMPLRLEKRHDPPKDEETLYLLDNIGAGDSHIGVGGLGMGCADNAPGYLSVDKPNIHNIDGTCLLVMTQGPSATEDARIVAKSASLVKKRENNEDYDIISNWSLSDTGIDPPPEDATSCPCSEVSPSGNICKMIMKDRLNKEVSLLRVKKRGDGIFIATDRPGTEDAWNVRVTVPNNNCDDYPMDIKAGVPSTSCNKLLSRYEMLDDSQLTFVEDEKYPCTSFGKNIIYFLIMEWYYFG